MWVQYKSIYFLVPHLYMYFPPLRNISRDKNGYIGLKQVEIRLYTAWFTASELAKSNMKKQQQLYRDFKMI